MDYVPKKKVKSPGPIAVLGLQNKVTWMDMVKKWELGVLVSQKRAKGRFRFEVCVWMEVVSVF